MLNSAYEEFDKINGQTEADNPCTKCGRWKNPSPCSEAIVVKNINNIDHILLIERGNDPFKGKLALPGGYIDYGEAPHKAAIRELKEEAGIQGFDPRLVCAPGEKDRDPLRHTIAMVYWL